MQKRVGEQEKKGVKIIHKGYMLHLYIEESKGGNKKLGQCYMQSDICCISTQKRVGDARKKWGQSCPWTK